MLLNIIQKDVHEWTVQYTPQYWPPHEILAHITEEAGELAEAIKTSYGPRPKSSVQKELPDIMFGIACMANSQGIDLKKEWYDLMHNKTSSYIPKTSILDEIGQVFKPNQMDQYLQLIELSSDLSSSLGRLAREVNHLYGNKKKKAEESESTLGKELSSILYDVVCISKTGSVNLYAQWAQMMEKKQYGRDNDRFEKKE